MTPVFDIDAIVLQAVALAAKRGPATLMAIMAAADLTPGALSAEFKLTDSFHRLSVHGLIASNEAGIELSTYGQTLMAAQPRKSATPELRLLRVKESLAEFAGTAEHPAIGISVDQLRSAIAAHKTASRQPGRNLAMPKHTIDPAKDKRKGQWRKSATGKTKAKRKLP